VGNRENSKEIMELLLARDANIEITEAVVTVAAGNKRNGKEVMELLLARDANIEITEAVVAAAAEQHEVVKLLLASIKNTDSGDYGDEEKFEWRSRC